MKQTIGKQSVKFTEAPYILEGASLVGKKEGEGPLQKLFDEIENDPLFGQDNWEAAEAELQKRTANMLLVKSGKMKEDIRYIFSGDLQGQLTATSYGLADIGIPVIGLYGACSTMGEALCISSMAISAGCASHVIAMASSHFASAEKNFRFPLEYGNQRPFSATWTVTGCGAVLLGYEKGFARVTGFTVGKITDYGLKDSQNMGACMAPAAAQVLGQHFEDFNSSPEDYDKIITGDLGYIGKEILCELLKKKGYDIEDVYMDCGIEIYDKEKQDTHAGGSGCGCSASVLTSYIFRQLKKKNFKKILFVPTGALLSTTTFNEGKSVPGVAYCVMIEACN